MAKPSAKRRRVPAKRTNKAYKQKREKTRKKALKRKSKKDKAVSDLADRLMGSATVDGVAKAPLDEKSRKKAAKKAKDVQMAAEPPPTEAKLSRQELRKKLRAAVASRSLDRTQGLDKGLTDSRGLKKRVAHPSAVTATKGKADAMDTK
mmetsp:Transcript_105736/g.305927  ORF Transcript_105736/g.305927 Transcript_105736/m.305927 type:complete len:149 (-) Transcript_105736:103-549(-)